MSTAQLVVQHLPYLRRYARALTGSQMAGDAYVAATLETLVNEPETIGGAGNVKVELFRVFTRIWNSLSVNGRGEQIQRDLPAEVRIGQITPLPRQAFLLSCLEGFSEEEVGAIGEAVVGCAAPVRGLSLGRPAALGRGRALSIDLLDPRGECAALQRRVSEALTAIGAYDPEQRPYRPHLTVARGDRVRVRGLPELPQTGAFDGRAVTLFRSHLGRGGARYEPLASAPL